MAAIPFAVLLDCLPNDLFQSIYRGVPRKVRNLMEGRLLPKARASKTFSLASLKPNQDVSPRIREAIVSGKRHELAEELIKAWLLERRDMLGKTLDTVGIPHDRGITDESLDPLLKLPQDTFDPLVAHLMASGHKPEDIAVYLAYLGMVQSLANPTLREVWTGWTTLDKVRTDYFEARAAIEAEADAKEAAAAADETAEEEPGAGLRTTKEVKEELSATATSALEKALRSAAADGMRRRPGSR